MNQVDPTEQPEAWPRVLFITPCAFNSVTGGGVTFSNLFRGWPKDRLACVSSDNFPVSRAVCDHYYMLGSNECVSAWPWSVLRPSRAKAKIDPQPDGAEDARRDGSDASCASSDSPAEASFPKRIARRLLGTAGLPVRGALSSDLRNWVADFKPELIYTILGDVSILDLVEQIADAFDLPIVIHCMDDGVTEPRRTGLYGRWFNRTYRSGLSRLLPRAADRLAICDAMADVYAQRYGQPFGSFHNAVDVAHIAERHRPLAGRNTPPRLIYVGSLYPIAQDRSLLDLCEAVARLNVSGQPVELGVYASRQLFGRYVPQVERHAGCTFHDALDDDAWFFEAIASADGLVLPVNFDAASRQYVGLSMPTKVPAYLASGTPTLVYGPGSVAQVHDARNMGWGLVVDQQDPAALDTAIRRLLGEAELRQTLVDRSLKLAYDHHDAPEVRRRLRDTLRRATTFGNDSQ